jgi:hypothetical protein
MFWGSFPEFVINLFSSTTWIQMLGENDCEYLYPLHLHFFDLLIASSK